jgi:amidase
MDAHSAAELGGIDAIGQAALAAAGDVTATELLDAAILRLESARGLNAVITELFERGRAQASALDSAGVLRAGRAQAAARADVVRPGRRAGPRGLGQRARADSDRARQRGVVGRRDGIGAR